MSESRKRSGFQGSLRLVQTGNFRLREVAVAMRSPRDVYQYMLPLVQVELVENLWILCLDIHHRVSHLPIVVSTGILDSSLIHPREIFRPAIHVGAAAIIVVHNHPSGDPTPSPDDRRATEQLVSAGRIIGIPVHDHIITGDGRFVSFAEAGLL